MPVDKYRVQVPRGDEITMDPHYVAGKDVVRVGNWILKGVYKAQHEYERLSEYFPLGEPIPAWPVLPQYIDDPDDRRNGDFAVDVGREPPELLKRAVCWDRDAFLKEMEKFGPVVEGEHLSPISVTVVAVGKHWAPWKSGDEYAFRVWWSVADDIDWPNPTTYYLDVKAGRDGNISLSGALTREDPPTTLNDNIV